MAKTRLIACGFFSLLMLAIAQPAFASKIVCPVCGQAFDESTAVCPNDGTDLKLLGKKTATPDGGVLDESGDAAEKDPPPKRKKAEGKPEGASPVTSTSGGYKRHGEGDGRRVLDEVDSAEYSDRRSRLPADTRTTGSARHRRMNDEDAPPSQTVEDDAAFFLDYEKKRRLLRRERRAERSAREEALRERALAREQLLNSSAAPLTSLGARFFFLPEGRDAGWTGGGEIDFHFARRRVRAGVSTFLGMRNLDARNESVFWESLSLGAQLPGRFSPFIVVRGGLGALATERFGTDLVYLLTSIGVEAGVDAWVSTWFVIEPSLGFERYRVKNAYWNSFTWKLCVGF